MPTKAKPKPRIEHPDPDAIYRAKWTAATREAYHKESPQNFAGDNMSFPIRDASDVNDAWRLAGHAPDPDAVRSKIKAIAKRLGLTSGLPDTAKEDDDKSSERAATPDNKAPDDPLDDILGNPDDSDADEDDHAVMDGIEDADCDDGSDERSQIEADIVRADLPTDIQYYAPITRINKEKREIIGVATAEIKDAYRTVIGYEASKDAFARWRGNIREMHQSKAVGRALEIIPDDDHRRIIVRARISKGAQDTWEKILDGTLTGFSIGGKNGVWTKRVIDGEELPYLERYDQAELSVVDNPACPASSLEIVRADGIASDILAKDEEMEPKTPEIARSPSVEPAETIERIGAKHSKDTVSAMHDVRNHQLLGAMKSMKSCGCDECAAACKMIDPDDDGDIDLGGLYDPDDDAKQVMADRAVLAQLTRDIKASIDTAVQATLAPVIQRVNALLASDAQRSENPDITRRVDGIDAQLTAIKDLVEKIAAQPLDGGPVLHGGPGIAQDKRLALHGGAEHRADDAEILRRALELGFSPPSSPEAQVLAASKFIRR